MGELLQPNVKSSTASMRKARARMKAAEMAQMTVVVTERTRLGINQLAQIKGDTVATIGGQLLAILVDYQLAIELAKEAKIELPHVGDARSLVTKT